MTKDIIQRCEQNGLRMTDQRRTVAQVLEASQDHPDVEELYARALKLDPRISIATVYRSVKLFEESGILEKLEFGDGRARYEDAERDNHDHLIDMNSGEVVEFIDPDIEALQEKIAERLGYRLKGHRLELYGVPIKRSDDVLRAKTRESARYRLHHLGNGCLCGGRFLNQTSVNAPVVGSNPSDDRFWRHAELLHLEPS